MEVIESDNESNGRAADEWQDDYLDSSSTDQVDQEATSSNAIHEIPLPRGHYSTRGRVIDKLPVDDESESKYVDYEEDDAF